MQPAVVTFPHRATAADPELAVAHLGDRATLASQLSLPIEDSDATMLAAAHERWGRAAPERLTGAFGFGFRVPGADTVRLARDVTGQVPLYYAITASGVVAGTDLSLIAADPAISDEVDLSALAHLYAHAHRPWLRRTGLRAVAKVPPGCFVEIHHGRAREVRYWRPERIRTDRRTSAEGQLDRLDQTLQRVVADCLHGHEKVGTHLSGGLDSALVTAVAQRTPPGVLQAYSWSPPFAALPRMSGDERDRVLSLAHEWSIPVRFVGGSQTVSVGEFDPVLRPRLASVHEAAVLTDASHCGVTLLLSGWGGDEALSALRAPHRVRHWRRRAARLTRRAGPSTGEAVAAEWRADWPDVAREVRRGFAALQRPGSLRRRQLAWLDNGHLAARNESWYAAAAAVDITYAYPLQDRRMLELVLAAPPELTMSGTWHRILARRLAARYLPRGWAWSREWKSSPAQVFPSVTPTELSDPAIATLLDLRERAGRRVRQEMA